MLLPSVSVVIPTYNRAEDLSNCLNAIRKTDYQGVMEIIVVNDGGDKQAEEICRQYNVKYLFQENQGPAAARNNGVKIAAYDYIFFTDDDCMPLPDCMNELINPFLQNADIIATKGVYLSRQKSIISQFVQLEYEDRYDHMRRFQYIDFIDTYCAMYKKAVFVEMGGFDETLIAAEDAELSYRLNDAGYRMLFTDQAKVFHKHPEKLLSYLNRKYKFAYWRWLATRKRQSKQTTDSHTSAKTKFSVLFPVFLCLGLLISFINPALGMVFIALLFLTFMLFAKDLIKKAFLKDYKIGFMSTGILVLRSIWQVAGLAKGVFKGFVKTNVAK